MASTYTPNLSVEKPASGDYVGTWDSPVNANMVTFDTAIGTIQAVDLSGGSVTLSTAQARSAFLNFTGALPSNVTVTIPGLSSAPGTTISGKGYTVQNLCSNSSQYTVTLQTTVAGQRAICAPPFDPTDILIEGTNSSRAGSLFYRNLGRVGTYWDYAGSSVPAWVSGCTVPPYLSCNGTTFSSATYPALATILGGTTLPDTRGRVRAALNEGTGRMTVAGGGIDGNNIFAAGGSQATTLSSQNVPPVLINDPGHTHNIAQKVTTYVAGATGSVPVWEIPVTYGSSYNQYFTATGYTGITAANASPTSFTNLPPSYVGGITLIRAA